MSDNATRRWRAALAVITIGGLALRIAYVLITKNPRTPSGDDFYFHHGANLLVDGRGFIDPIALFKAHRVTPGAVHPPAYIVFLATSSLFGFRSYLDHQIWSCLLGTATIPLIAVTGRAIAGRGVGLIAAFLAAVYPNFWFHDSVVMSETLIIFTTTLVILVAYRFWQRPTPGTAVLLGAAVGLAVLTRAETILLVLVLLAPIAYWLRDVDRRARLKLFAVATGAVLLVISPWVIYNLTRFEHPVTLSTNLEATLASANCDQVYYHSHDLGSWSFACFVALRPPQIEASKSEIFFRHKVEDYVKKHAARVPVVVVAREARTWGLYNPIEQLTLDQIEGEEGWLARIGLGMFYVLAGAGIAGAVVLRRRRVTLVPVLGVVVAVAVTVAAVYGTTRFRTPAEPPIALLAAVAFAEAFEQFRRRRSEKHGPDPSGRPGPSDAASTPSPTTAPPRVRA